ncbi:ABC transporter ATP-binding protein [Lentzea tibetensis]|uniref:ABC transporter ATP-binding protein n=1 Tax=Lentzea tibetensis TaxID=2591470 RepID=A0A563EN54_9PSEU|nr:ABC transporter ATP-binding protein [Lentzea tibetensis]TWP48616.1 ABC transporter ATP-binding protein [Lentzea tibetensis]
MVRVDEEAVLVDNLVKVYKPGQKPAVDGLSFSVRRGEVFGLLGPNGAGKTTTVGVLTTRVRPTSGKATVEGVDVVTDSQRARQLLAVVPQRNNLDRSLNARQNLLFHAAYHGVGRAERNALADEILERMGLADHKKALVDTLSGGQAQRLMIARALMHKPKVLFLDEPSTGLDPQARLFVHERVQALHEEGVTVVLTTHDMDEAAKLCDRVGIVDHGKLLTLDTPEELTRSLPGSTTVSVTVSLNGSGSEPVTKALSEVDGVQRVEEVGDMFRVYTDVDTSITLPAVLGTLQKLDVPVSDLSIGKPSLEDVFIHLTGRELR